MTDAAKSPAQQQQQNAALMRKVAIAAALIAGCSVVIAAALALRLVETRERATIAAAQCACCDVNTPREPQIGEHGEADAPRR